MMLNVSWLYLAHYIEPAWTFYIALKLETKLRSRHFEDSPPKQPQDNLQKTNFHTESVNLSNLEGRRNKRRWGYKTNVFLA